LFYYLEKSEEGLTSVTMVLTVEIVVK